MLAVQRRCHRSATIVFKAMLVCNSRLDSIYNCHYRCAMLARNLGTGPDQSWQPRKRPTQQSNRLSPMCAAHVAGEGVKFPRLKLCSDPWNLCCARGELRVPSVSLVKLQCSLEPLCSGERSVLSASLREDGKGEGSLRQAGQTCCSDADALGAL